MAHAGYGLGFTEANVVQERTPQHYVTEFISEIPMHLNSRKIIKTVSDCIDHRSTATDNSVRAYEGLVKQAVAERSAANRAPAV